VLVVFWDHLELIPPACTRTNPVCANYLNFDKGIIEGPSAGLEIEWRKKNILGFIR
jgi:hypothetical protein